MEEGWKGKKGKKGEKLRRYRASLSLGHYASELRKVRSGEPTAHFRKEGIARIMLGWEGPSVCMTDHLQKPAASNI
jgi:hypothetical protein